MLDFESISAVAFVGIVIVLAIIDRKHIEFKQGLIMRRTERGKKWLYEIARKHQRLINWLTTIGVVVGFAVSIITFAILGYSVYNMFANPEKAIQQGPTSKIIFFQVGNVQCPNFVLCIPFWYWLIGIFVVVSVHEPFHAFAARLKNVTIKSLGLALLAIFPVAFVEPDDNQVKKLKPLSKMRIYAAGSFANLLVSSLSILIVLGLTQLSIHALSPVGVSFAVINNTPAGQANLQGVIVAVNDKQANDVETFSKIMSGLEVNETIRIRTTYGTYNLTTTTNPQNSSKAFIGVGLLDNYYGPVYSWVSDLFAWLFIINLGVGSLNLLPVRYLDGGYLYEILLQRFFSKKAVNNIITALSLIFLFFIVFSLFGPSILDYFIHHLFSL